MDCERFAYFESVLMILSVKGVALFLAHHAFVSSEDDCQPVMLAVGVNG